MNYTEDKELSRDFYHYLCNIIGSEDVVKTRRNIFTVMDFIINTCNTYKHITFISSGSRAEGIDLKGSDYDQMHVREGFRVYESIMDENEGVLDEMYTSNKLPLLMDYLDTKPGFTKLKLYNKVRIHTNTMQLTDKWSYTFGNDTFLSSKIIRESELYPGTVIHGPCQSIPDKLDIADCFRCKEWILQAKQWIDRPRSTWPDYKLVTTVVQYGVLFVPIGCKNSPSEDIEWRISFSMAEKQLICSFAHSQLLCYALLKVVLKDIIKPNHGDLICSYFLKTIMFWLCEESNPSEWKPERTISCFMKCLRRLIYCVEYKTCLHYFIPDNNLFDERFTDEQQAELLYTLRLIYTSPWVSIFATSTFQKYITDSGNSPILDLTSSSLSCLFYPHFLMQNRMLKLDHATIKRSLMAFIFFPHDEFCKYMMSVCLNKCTQRLNVLIFNRSNKSLYKDYNITLGGFMLGLFSDALTSWLQLASFFYKCKRFQLCIDIITYCLSKCTTDKLYVRVSNSLKEQTVFQKIKQAVGLCLTCKHFILQDVRFIHPFHLLPTELITLTTICKYVKIPPVVYCNMLLLLCFHHLHDASGKRNAVRDLELAIREMCFFDEDNFGTVDRCLEISNEMI
ncbi:uncharacterized protein LOC127736485 [Mytilus californianus]|uniref:uncharacterized protein LOC127736485 n=1 Tax=Mytilus californianus TaxID=6549 RepID=UPI002247E82B|nr:uncharacterized protein LOC127736485 [Mytilus californianus]